MLQFVDDRQKLPELPGNLMIDRVDRPFPLADATAPLADATDAQAEARIRPMFDDGKLVFYGKDDWRLRGRIERLAAGPKPDHEEWTGVSVFKAARPRGQPEPTGPGPTEPDRAEQMERV